MPGSARSCCLCIHCGDGIPYNKFYFNCMRCDKTICNPCLSAHPREHRQYLKKAIDKSLARDAEPDEKDCANCMQMIEARVECAECDLRYCTGCWMEKPVQAKVTEHEHKSIKFLRIPDDYQLDYYELECECCKNGKTLVHCGTCYEGIKDGETFYWCKVCIKIYLGDSVQPCVKCLPIVKADHNPDHEFMSVVYKEIDGAADDLFRAHCLDCGKDFKDLSATSIGRHPHLNYQMSIGKQEREFKIHGAVRRCPRRPIQERDLQPEELHNENLECSVCWDKFPKGAKIHSCRDCNFTTCSPCYSNVVDHRHPMVAMQLCSTLIPDDYYKELVLGEKNRTCDICKEVFRPGITNYLQCNNCLEYDICNTCLFPEAASADNPRPADYEDPFTLFHGKCSNFQDAKFTYHTPREPPGKPDFAKEQMELAEAFAAEYTAQQEAEAEAQEYAAQQEAEAEAERVMAKEREREATRRRSELQAERRAEMRQQKEQAEQRAKEAEAASIAEAEAARIAKARAPQSIIAPARKPVTSVGKGVANLMPPQRQTAQRRKSSSGLGTALLKGGLQILSGVAKAEARANSGGGGGGGFGGDSGGFSGGNSGGMDMSSFWAPINSAASDPIQ